ncbi:hypothetical protein EVAR_79187_1 [Eumeta japonica]|uniref:Uncharacterized protein n=1 Tax=Eumeta variegata TaxID=151549 RepID=A0A4C1UT77_EUMVA|nr:hypothetical protein EVAR_79187_1 [Eumeta japonica]
MRAALAFGPPYRDLSAPNTRNCSINKSVASSRLTPSRSGAFCPGLRRRRCIKSMTPGSPFSELGLTDPSSDFLCREDLLEIPHKVNQAPSTPLCVVRPRTVKLNRKPANSIADSVMFSSEGLFYYTPTGTCEARAAINKSEHRNAVRYFARTTRECVFRGDCEENPKRGLTRRC